MSGDSGYAARASRLVAALIAIAAFAVIMPSATLGVGEIDGVHANVLEDYDGRSGSVAPTSQQLQMVAALGARAEWNSFGTPHSLVKHGGYLATGLSGAGAATVARNWINANRALFRLASADVLELVGDSSLARSNGHAVQFRQEFDGVQATEEAMITVGVVGTQASGWKIASVSSNVTEGTTLAGQPQISPAEAWASAAADVGRPVPIVNVNTSRTDGDWTILRVSGFADPQRARLRALPTPTDGTIPVFETIVLDSSASLAYKHYVDARSGEVVIRQNILEHSHQPNPDTFSGSFGSVDGGCGPMHGPYTPHSNTVSIDVIASADLPANDIVLKLYFNGVLIQAADTATSPEAIHYEPSGGVPAGNYTVEVCEFQDGAAPLPPTTYSGLITFNDVAGGAVPYPPKWKVFPANPLLGLEFYPWLMPSTDSRKVWCWDSNVNGNPIAGCDEEVGNSASRVPWDADPLFAFSAPTFTTRGNNAHTRESWFSPLTPGPTAFSPTSPQRNYDYPWTNAWYEPGNSCFEPFLPGVSHDISAAVVDLFAMHNRMHDWSYHLGFTEENWNAQENNFGLTAVGRQNDSLLGDAQAGAVTGSRDNANMVSLPEGTHPITNMYLWQPIAGGFYPPCVDGDYDMGVIGHEYGHLIENRMIGKGGTRTGHHAGAMGESSGDLLGMEVLNEYSYVPVSGENRYAIGTYDTGNHSRAIRNYGMNFQRTGAFPAPSESLVHTTSPIKVNPLNFGDMGYDEFAAPPVHADGEIWSAANFDVRQALVDKYNATFPESDAALQRECAEGQRPANLCPGNRRWIQIMYDAYLLMPVNPSMLTARDMYLAADMMRFGGANQNEIWLAFTRRGFGQNAFSSILFSSSDTDPKPDYASPNHTETTVTFTAFNDTSIPTANNNARIYVGHYEARVSPIADTNPATNAPPTTPASTNNLDNVAQFVAGTYEFYVHAPGRGHFRFRKTFTGTGSTTVAITLPTNHASSANGATASGDGADEAELIDDTEATNWESTVFPVANKQVTVDLAGATARLVTRIQVSAALGAQNRFTALRSFEIRTCTAAVPNLNCTAPPLGFTTIFTSASDAFPAVAPRPVLPEIILREFDVTDTSATHVQLRVLSNQCTGGGDFAGEQDMDPVTTTDCQAGSTNDNTVRAAELQVFTNPGNATGGNGPPPPPPPPGPPPPPPGPPPPPPGPPPPPPGPPPPPPGPPPPPPGPPPPPPGPPPPPPGPPPPPPGPPPPPPGPPPPPPGPPPPPPPPPPDCEDDDDLFMVGPATAAPGSLIEYAITYTNSRDDDDDDECEIDDFLDDDDLTYVSSSDGGSYDPATGAVTWTLGNVSGGLSKTVTVTARVSSTAQPGTLMISQAQFSGLLNSPLATTATMVLP